jgi:hypothetical protein
MIEVRTSNQRQKVKGLRRTLCAVERAAIKRFFWLFLRQCHGIHDVAGAFAARQLTTVFGG